MKLLVLLFLVGYATANVYEALEDEAEYFYHEFMLGLEESGTVEDAVGHEILLQAEDDIKTEIGKKLRETLNEILSKMKEAVDQGKDVKEDMMNKAKEIREKMRELKVELGNKAKEMMEKLKERVKGFWKDLLDKMKGDKKRSVEDPEYMDFNFKDIFKKLKEALLKNIDKEKLKEKVEKIFGKGSEMGDSLLKLINEKGDKYKQKLLDLVDRFLGKDDEKRSIEDPEYFDFNLKDMFKKLRDDLLKNIDKEKLKEKVEEIFGKGNKMGDSLLKLINEKGDKYKQKLLDMIDRFLGKKEEKRSIAEYWEKVKEYFKNLKIDLKEKYMKFGEWVKNTFKDGLDKSKSKLENIKEIAREFIDHTKGVSKEVAIEAKEFLRPYKEDLGSLWEQVKDAVKDIVNRKD